MRLDRANAQLSQQESIAKRLTEKLMYQEERDRAYASSSEAIRGQMHLVMEDRNRWRDSSEQLSMALQQMRKLAHDASPDEMSTAFIRLDHV